MNDQGIGRGAKVVSGTVRDSLHMVDVIFGLDGGELPEIVVSDTGSYSDLVFGLLELLGISLPARPGRPAPTRRAGGSTRRRLRSAEHLRPGQDRPGEGRAGTGRTSCASSPRSTPGPSAPTTSCTMLQRDGHPTALGEAIAAYGRIFKTLHILTYMTSTRPTGATSRASATCRKAATPSPEDLPRQEGRALPPLRTRNENQLGALGLVLNCVVLWTTVYLDAAVRQLTAQGYPVREEDMTRLSPFAQPPPRRPRHLQLPAPRPGPRRDPRSARP